MSRMNAAEQRVWEEVVESAEYTSKYDLTFDTTTFHGKQLLKYIARANAFLAANREIVALRKVMESLEGVLKAIDDAGSKWGIVQLSNNHNAVYDARAALNAAKGEKR